MSVRAGLVAALVLAFVPLASARAANERPIEIPPPKKSADAKPGAPSPDTTSPATPRAEPADAATEKPTAGATTTPDKVEKPYVSGWRAGTPPGDTVRIRFEYWLADMGKGTAFEFDHGGRRVGALRTGSLGYGATQSVFGGQVEVDAGQYGFYELEYLQLDLSGRTHRIQDGDHTFVDTVFPQGDVVESRVAQHYAKLRDGVDVRYRFALGEGISFDLSFGPVFGLGLRYESMDVSSVVAPRSDGSHFFALTILPGFRLGADLHLPARMTVRAGVEADWLPNLGHTNILSFTREPSITIWHDVRAFLAFRFWFLELDAGYRFFEVESGRGWQPGGGRLRVGNAALHGFDAGITVAF